MPYLSQWSRHFNQNFLFIEKFSLKSVLVIFGNFVSEISRQFSMGHILLDLFYLKIKLKQW